MSAQLPWLPSLPPDDGWAARGACRGSGVPVSEFFPSIHDAYPFTVPFALCAKCDVRSECLDFALAHKLPGIWGGTTERQRRRMKARAA